MASLTSSTLYGSRISLPYQSSGSSLASSSSRSYHPNVQVLCQQSTTDISEQRTNLVPRRSVAVATVLAVLMQSYSLQEAHAARKKMEATEKKPEDDPSLSAYDAKLLATYRRKEAMKEAMAKLKEKSLPRKPVVKSEPEVATKAPETPAVPVTTSASEATKESVDTAVPSSE